MSEVKLTTTSAKAPEVQIIAGHLAPLVYDDLISNTGFVLPHYVRPKESDPDWRDERVEFNSIINKIESIHLWTPYDQLVLNSTCALSIVKPSHTAIEETGWFAIHTLPFEEETIKALEDRWTKLYLKVSAVEPSLSIHRGKNTGWPFFVSGTNRRANDALLLIMAEYVLDRKGRGYSLKDIYSELQGIYGNPYLFYAERYQHTTKEVPFRGDGIMLSKNFEPRVRLVQGSDKIAVTFNRWYVKKFLLAILASREHVQDKKVIKQRISDNDVKYKNKIVIDQSTLDRRMGSPKGSQIAQLIQRITGAGDNIETEFMHPSSFMYDGKLYFAKGGSILSSGVSSTSLEGTLGAEGALIEAVSGLKKQSAATTVAQIGQTWDFLGWGDDGVLWGDFTFEEIKPYFETKGWKVDVEPVTKYLGVVYDANEREYPASRFFQNAVFPEKKYTQSPILSLAMYSRKQQLNDEEAYEHIINTFGSDILRDVSFKFGMTEQQVLRPTEEDAIMATKIVQERIGDYITELDSILYSLGHGEIDPMTLSYVGLDLDSLLRGREQYLSIETLRADIGKVHPDWMVDGTVKRFLKEGIAILDFEIQQ